MKPLFKNVISKSIKKNKKIQTLKDLNAYSKIYSREILIDTITPQIADEVDSLIRFWNAIDDEDEVLFSEREPIKIYIDSYGGNINAALTIMDSIKISRTPIYTINIGTVYKESFFIYLVGHRRYTYQMASFMFHKDTKQFDENETESNFFNYTSLCQKQEEELKRLLLDKTKITENQYEKHCKNDWWFSADDAHKLSICNEVLRNHAYNK